MSSLSGKWRKTLAQNPSSKRPKVRRLVLYDIQRLNPSGTFEPFFDVLEFFSSSLEEIEIPDLSWADDEIPNLPLNLKLKSCACLETECSPFLQVLSTTPSVHALTKLSIVMDFFDIPILGHFLPLVGQNLLLLELNLEELWFGHASDHASARRAQSR